MSEIPRAFKGIWISRRIWLDRTLTPLQKMLIAEIDSLSTDEGSCSASNEYLSNFFSVSVGRMANMITDLRKRGIIETVSFNGRKRCIRVKSAFTENVNADNHGKREVSLHGKRESLYIERKDKNKGEDVLGLEVEEAGKETELTRQQQAAEIYSLYPLHVGRPIALKAIIKAIEHESYSKLLFLTNQFAKARNGDISYIPHPATWFNQERYNDDPETWKPKYVKGNNSQQPALPMMASAQTQRTIRNRKE